MAQHRIWSASDRDAFVMRARTVDDDLNFKGCEDSYRYSVLPKRSGCGDAEDDRKAKVTKALMSVIFKTPEYRVIALKIYDILLQKIVSHPLTCRMFQKDILVVLKGGTSYTYIVSAEHADVFPFSDLDIVVMINPYMPARLFAEVKSVMSTLILQTISQYKRMLDHMLFLNKPINDSVLRPETIEAFKEDLTHAFDAIEDDQGVIQSPFVDTTTRNRVSKNSFVLCDSLVREDKIVRVEVPHFELCERIPLRRTPIFCSYNSSIHFNRVSEGNGEKVGSFDLFRVRFNAMLRRNEEEGVPSDTDSSSSAQKFREYECITADFIDISVPNKNDAELIDFWEHGQVASVYDPSVRLWVTIPDLRSMLYDLDKMLNVYECPESKRARRQARHDVLSMYAKQLCR